MDVKNTKKRQILATDASEGKVDASVRSQINESNDPGAPRSNASETGDTSEGSRTEPKLALDASQAKQPITEAGANPHKDSPKQGTQPIASSMPSLTLTSDASQKNEPMADQQTGSKEFPKMAVTEINKANTERIQSSQENATKTNESVHQTVATTLIIDGATPSKKVGLETPKPDIIVPFAKVDTYDWSSSYLPPNVQRSSTLQNEAQQPLTMATPRIQNEAGFSGQGEHTPVNPKISVQQDMSLTPHIQRVAAGDIIIDGVVYKRQQPPQHVMTQGHTPSQTPQSTRSTKGQPRPFDPLTSNAAQGAPTQIVSLDQIPDHIKQMLIQGGPDGDVWDFLIEKNWECLENLPKELCLQLYKGTKFERASIRYYAHEESEDEEEKSPPPPQIKLDSSMERYMKFQQEMWEKQNKQMEALNLKVEEIQKQPPKEHVNSDWNEAVQSVQEFCGFDSDTEPSPSKRGRFDFLEDKDKEDAKRLPLHDKVKKVLSVCMEEVKNVQKNKKCPDTLKTAKNVPAKLYKPKGMGHFFTAQTVNSNIHLLDPMVGTKKPIPTVEKELADKENSDREMVSLMSARLWFADLTEDLMNKSEDIEDLDQMRTLIEAMRSVKAQQDKIDVFVLDKSVTQLSNTSLQRRDNFIKGSQQAHTSVIPELRGSSLMSNELFDIPEQKIKQINEGVRDTTFATSMSAFADWVTHQKAQGYTSKRGRGRGKSEYAKRASSKSTERGGRGSRGSSFRAKRGAQNYSQRSSYNDGQEQKYSYDQKPRGGQGSRARGRGRSSRSRGRGRGRGTSA